MIINRVKDSVHGFMGDGFLAKSIRSGVEINLTPGQIKTLSKDEVLSAIKVAIVLDNTGEEELIFPQEYAAIAPIDQILFVYAGGPGIKLTNAYGTKKVAPGWCHLINLGGLVAPVGMAGEYVYAAAGLHAPIWSFIENETASMLHWGCEWIYEGNGGHTFTIDGSILMPDNAKIELGNVSDFPLDIVTANGAQVFGVTTLAAKQKIKLIKINATNNWYSI